VLDFRNTGEQLKPCGCGVFVLILLEDDVVIVDIINNHEPLPVASVLQPILYEAQHVYLRRFRNADVF
jgi:hypothetical protein